MKHLLQLTLIDWSYQFLSVDVSDGETVVNVRMNHDSWNAQVREVTGAAHQLKGIYSSLQLIAVVLGKIHEEFTDDMDDYSEVFRGEDSAGKVIRKILTVEVEGREIPEGCVVIG